MSSPDRPLYINATKSIPSTTTIGRSGDNLDQPYEFHKTLPAYKSSPLIALSDLARGLGLKAVYVKDESARFGLPSFKSLGASWGTYQALLQRLSLPSETNLENLSDAAKRSGVRLIAATDGNHGRAVAWIARHLQISAEIFIPHGVDESQIELIADEGATIVRINEDYDNAVQRAMLRAKECKGVLVQDTAFEGYEEIPAWIVDGYGTMFRELETQLADLGLAPTALITPVGVGSLAHAVATAAHSVSDRDVQVITVEPDTAACLYHSLRAGSPQSITTGQTIMAGMNCGTVSTSAWLYLRDHVDISVTVSDTESYKSMLYLQSKGVSSGPCGAAAVAALRRVCQAGHFRSPQDAVVVLLNTEGHRNVERPPGIVDDGTGVR